MFGCYNRMRCAYEVRWMWVTFNMVPIFRMAASMPNSNPTSGPVRPLAEEKMPSNLTETSRVHVEEVSSWAARVCWGHGSTGKDGFSRLLYRDLKDEDDNAIQTHVIMQPFKRSYFMVDLKPRTRYEVCVFDPKLVYPLAIDCTVFTTKDDREEFKFRVKAWGIMGMIGLMFLITGAVFRVAMWVRKKIGELGKDHRGKKLITVSDQLAPDAEESISERRQESREEILNLE
ncbi:Hypp8939 [Branchiostoma lanceolatum]|uniref:Hypp8939 protein n=1 Tax=Branchiostoma lanceolatum TaxID=7740 RepID=A0A8J9ZCZ2_BRALA|nr:Hypp8939 [Branchiostoma lanceolatum]